MKITDKKIARPPIRDHPRRHPIFLSLIFLSIFQRPNTQRSLLPRREMTHAKARSTQMEGIQEVAAASGVGKRIRGGKKKTERLGAEKWGKPRVRT
jgi:hypothetical protein